MTISIHKPAYLPWLGYFDKIINSDIFIYFNSVQFEKNSFINRNKIKTPNGESWLTIPVKTKDYKEKNISQLEIDYSRNWINSHLKTIESCYKKSVNYNKVFEVYKLSLEKEHVLLSDLCYEQLLCFLELLNVKDKIIIKSSSLNLQEKKSDLVLEICKHFKANTYLSGKFGSDYLLTDTFTENNIEIKFQDFISPTYNQLWGSFIPNLGVIDYLMNNNI